MNSYSKYEFLNEFILACISEYVVSIAWNIIILQVCIQHQSTNGLSPQSTKHTAVWYSTHITLIPCDDNNNDNIQNYQFYKNYIKTNRPRKNRILSIYVNCALVLYTHSQNVQFYKTPNDIFIVYLYTLCVHCAMTIVHANSYNMHEHILSKYTLIYLYRLKSLIQIELTTITINQKRQLNQKCALNIPSTQRTGCVFKGFISQQNQKGQHYTKLWTQDQQQQICSLYKKYKILLENIVSSQIECNYRASYYQLQIC
eukprot:TRINITY_DN239_c0_g1_i4.p3 TRINITY_DN239_c0_g1~~TRINITY_DN239_c0_g1_i4.p3  ORF type:complete len:257 (+),score=-21.29 TRINITY_DN239_c0_g1_i4:643-1413(+)